MKTAKVFALILTCVSAMAGASELSAQANTEWRLVHVRFPERGSGCETNPSTRAGWMYIRHSTTVKDDYEAERAKFSKINKYPRMSYYRVRPGRPKVVALVTKQIMCKATRGGRKPFVNYQFMAGESLAAITAKAEKNRAEHPEEIMSFSIEVIDWEADIGALLLKGKTTGVGRDP